MSEKQYIKKLHENYELTNNMFNIKNTLHRNGHDTHNSTAPINQILSLLGYKYLSQKAEETKEDIGYKLDEEYHYKNLLINKSDIIGTLKKGIEQITKESNNLQAADVFYDIFTLIDFEKYPENDTWILFIELVEKLCSDTSATLGEAFNFATQYPQGTKNNIYKLKPSEILAKFIAAKVTEVENLYDPYATNGSLLVNMGKEINVTNYYGQHNEVEKYVLAKLNLLVNDINYKNIFIKHNDITKPNAWPNIKFDLSVTIPPFIGKGPHVMSDDERFKPFSPKRTSSITYLLDMKHALNNKGTIATILPEGLLFRGGIEKKIIKHLANNQLISTIISLPPGLFEETSIPTTLIILDNKPKEGIFYLNLLNELKDSTMTEKPLSLRYNDDYVEIIAKQKQIQYKTHTATLKEIQENDYNLSINRYVEQEQMGEIDIEQTLKNIKTLKKELEQADEELNAKIGGLFK